MSRSGQHAIAADLVFDGAVVHRDAAVVTDGATIAALVPRADLPAGLPVQRLPDGCWLAPGFIDVQVNGGGDVLFNDDPTPAGIRAIAAALAAVDEVMDIEPGVLGIHLEGPFLSPERPGVHALKHIRAPTPEDLALLTARRKSVALVTLAPECVPAGFIRELTRAGVRVS